MMWLPSSASEDEHGAPMAASTRGAVPADLIPPSEMPAGQTSVTRQIQMKTRLDEGLINS
jgi:hypothetical protein